MTTFGLAQPGSVCDTPISSDDLLPTINEISGYKGYNNQQMDGISLVSLLKDEVASDNRALYWHYPHYSNQGGKPGGAIRRGKWKLIEWYEDSDLELYDLESDIVERRNLASTMPDIAEELHLELVRWRAEVNATMPKSNPNYSKRAFGPTSFD